MNFLVLFIFRLPWLRQRVFSQLHGVLSHCSKLVQHTQWHIITVTAHTEPLLLWHAFLAYTLCC